MSANELGVLLGQAAQALPRLAIKHGHREVLGNFGEVAAILRACSALLEATLLEATLLAWPVAASGAVPPVAAILLPPIRMAAVLLATAVLAAAGPVATIAAAATVRTVAAIVATRTSRPGTVSRALRTLGPATVVAGNASAFEGIVPGRMGSGRISPERVTPSIPTRTSIIASGRTFERLPAVAIATLITATLGRIATLRAAIVATIVPATLIVAAALDVLSTAIRRFTAPAIVTATLGAAAIATATPEIVARVIVTPTVGSTIVSATLETGVAAASFCAAVVSAAPRAGCLALAVVVTFAVTRSVEAARIAAIIKAPAHPATLTIALRNCTAAGVAVVSTTTFTIARETTPLDAIAAAAPIGVVSPAKALAILIRTAGTVVPTEIAVAATVPAVATTVIPAVATTVIPAVATFAARTIAAAIAVVASGPGITAISVALGTTASGVAVA
ncbi:hypothetical protein GCM10010401_22820 [Rarobacter faecitabidus]|uniref:hypothetical protein n=1 Tax=Rarobacter faecitabidus TaxID=13243 RepID=UPI00114F2980|nr:hypothetical protein [Rarobacter faecitabidus]